MSCFTALIFTAIFCFISVPRNVGAIYALDSVYNWFMYPSYIQCPENSETCAADTNGYQSFVRALMYADSDASGSLDYGEYVAYSNVRTGAWFREADVVQSAGKPQFTNATYDQLWERWVESRLYQADSQYVAGWLNGILNTDMYAETLVSNGVRGSDVPKMADWTGAYLANYVGVTDRGHIDLVRFAAINEIVYGPYHR